MRVITLELNGEAYEAASLSGSEFKRASRCFIKMRDFSADPAAVIESIDGLFKVLHGSIRRAGSRLTLEELSDQIGPTDAIEAVVELLKSSTDVSIPKISLKVN